MEKYIIAPPAGSQTNALGAKNRPWEEVHANRYPGINEYLAESTGYGIVSGCEPSINGLTVTVSAGVIHTADGRRVEVPEQSITLDAADATKPRTDVVYLDKYGKIAKLTGELGTPAVAGSNTYTISTNFAAGDTVTFGGVVFTCTTSTQDATNFVLGADPATSATNLATALNANSSINAIYTASTSGSVVTIIEKSAGGGNTPGAMMTSGTGVMMEGTAVESTDIQMTTPLVDENDIMVGSVELSSVEDPVLEETRAMLAIPMHMGFINVKDFGALGDGVHDDTNAFQSALSAARNKCFFVPTGNYLINKNLFADGVLSVLDYGTYAYIKPVYPKSEKDVFIHSFDNFQFVDTIVFNSTNPEYSQGLGVDRNTKHLYVAGAYKTYEQQSIYEVNPKSVGTLLRRHDYAELGHANTITHCPERKEVIIDNCVTSDGVKSYTILDDTTLSVKQKLTTSFSHFGMSWDPICKLFCAHHNTGRGIELYLMDINFNLLRTVHFISAYNYLLNGGCCYDGVFFSPTFGYFGEYSLLGKELSIVRYDQSWELEDCDVIDNTLYLSLAHENGRTDIYRAQRNPVLKDNYVKDNMGIMTSMTAVIQKNRTSDLNTMLGTGSWFIFNTDVAIKNAPAWPGFLLKQYARNNYRRQDFYRESTIPGAHNLKATRDLYGPEWREIEYEPQIDAGKTEVLNVKANSVTDIKVTFNKIFASKPFITVSLCTVSDLTGLKTLSIAVRSDSITTTGFMVRIANSGDSDRAPIIMWTAIAFFDRDY